MGTTDHGTLVDQFSQIIPDCGEGIPQFFLEASNWNLQAAIMSYFDYGGGQQGVSSNVMATMPEAELVDDVTVGDGEDIPPNVVFQKTWRLRNW